MGAVYRHELGRHFRSMTGCVFGAFLLLFAGVFTVYYNVQLSYANFEFALGSSYMALVYVIAIPVLTMRVIAEERRQKTDQLLYSLPLNMTQVVVGKYLALLTVLVIPVALMSLYPLLLSAYGPLNLASAMGVLAGFFLLGAALMSMGLFVSALTESQGICAGVCFVVMLLNYFISDLAAMVGPTAPASLAAYCLVLAGAGYLVYRMTKHPVISAGIWAVGQIALLCRYAQASRDFEGSFGTLMGRLSLFDRYYDFVLGVLDLKSILYFVSVCVLFVVLTVQVMEKRRWSE